MFLDHVYQAAAGSAKEIPLNGKKVVVSDAMRRECQLIRLLHILSIGVFTMLGSSLASLFGEVSFWKDLLFISILLTLSTFIYNKMSHFLLRRKFGE